LLYSYECEQVPKQIIENPMLAFLVKTLFTFAKNLDSEISCESIKHVMDAITKIFSQYPYLKKSVIDLILIN
jgi:hypothetical protein